MTLSDCIGEPRKQKRNAETHQLVNPSICQSRDEAYNVELGTSMRHEITESYQAGRICIAKGVSCGPCWRTYNDKEIKGLENHIYYTAHSKASPQANVLRQMIDDKMSQMKSRYPFFR